MGSTHREREKPAWLEPLQEALLEALPRLYGATAEPPLAALIGDLVDALDQGRLSIPLPPDLAAGALASSGLCRDPDGPLVIEAGQVGWRRWHDLRHSVLSALLERVRPLDTANSATAPLEPAQEASATTTLASPAASSQSPRATESPRAPTARSTASTDGQPATETPDDRQLQAVEAVQTHRLVLLQGGPGTGKTSTVARMLAAVLARDPATRIHLAAPTGKAAARLRAATGGRHPCGTLHRLLESRGDHFARNRLHPLPLDLLVVDEVSMVDLALMAALLEALPATARLVLVGDPAQLPPIAPGAVLLDLQHPNLQAGLGNAAITLTTTYRNKGAIAAVAAALRTSLNRNAGTPLEVIRPQLELLKPNDNLVWQQSNPGRLPPALVARLAEHLTALAGLAAGCRPERPGNWRNLLMERDRLLVLAPRRRGPWGVEGIHRALLGEAAAAPATAWPEGLPVLCTRNLPELGLANGDVGVLVGRANSDDRQILFGGEEPLWVHPAQLAGAAEPALALTVHKAQGSEAIEVIVLLADPDPDARLLYTALTRARERAELITALMLAKAGSSLAAPRRAGQTP
jgi:exodeoxyribonuclease V alpha subunit